jgi:hypothetical protein
MTTIDLTKQPASLWITNFGVSTTSSKDVIVPRSLAEKQIVPSRAAKVVKTLMDACKASGQPMLLKTRPANGEIIFFATMGVPKEQEDE